MTRAPMVQDTCDHYALARLRRFRHSPYDVYEPDPNSIVVHNDREVATRDGTILRVNVSLPATGGPFRAIAGGHRWPLAVATKSADRPVSRRLPRQSKGTATVHWGPDHDARLLVPMIPR
jgi:predicted acyl esterase